MSREYREPPECGGQKAWRLWWATRKKGLVKVSFDGLLIWIMERRPSTLINDGFIIDAKEFLGRAAELLRIHPDDVFSLNDTQIRNVAREIAGIHPQAPVIAGGAEHEKK